MALGCRFLEHELPADLYADDIGDVQKLGGGNFRSIFFVWRYDGLIYKPVPVLSLVRPATSLGAGEVRKWLRQQPDPTHGIVLREGLHS
jgi:hypothetical protein